MENLTSAELANKRFQTSLGGILDKKESELEVVIPGTP